MATETHPSETAQEVTVAQQAENNLEPPRDPNYMPFDTEKTLPLVEIKGVGLVREADSVGVSPSMIQEYPSQFIKKSPNAPAAPEPAPESITVPQSPEVDQEQERRRQETTRVAAELATRAETIVG